MAGIFIKKHAQAVAMHQDLVVLAFTLNPGKKLYQLEKTTFRDEAGIETHQLHIETRFYKLVYMLLPLHYLLLKRYIREHISTTRTISTVHANVLFPCGIVGYWLSKRLRAKFLISEHWSKVNKFFKVSLYAAFGKKAYAQASAITCVSGQLAKTVASHTRNPKVFIVPNVIDSREFYYDPGVQKKEQLSFIAVAHWGREKNPFLFLDALEQLQREKTLQNFQVTLVGEGPKITLVQQGTYSFKIEFKGRLSAPEVRQELNASHVFLHGSDFETFSVIIAEALMCGLPAIVSPVGISEEVINAANGFIAQNTVADWKEKIMRCVSTSYDARTIAEQLKGKYDLATVAAQFAAVYQSVPIIR